MTTLPINVVDEIHQTPPQHHPYRWRLHRGGITNVWFYWDNEFDFSGGRLVLRGTNGSGKSRALEMLLPFVFDADRRRMDATGSGKVRIEDLMRTGDDSTNRLGYLWIELVRDSEDSVPEYLTVGALVRYSRATSEAKVWYFTTPMRIGHDLLLQDGDRIPLSRDNLASAIGVDRITDSPQVHRERVRSQVFGLTGESGKERFAGLLQLLHTLRSPDVGNRIDEGRLPHILSDALPPLSDAALTAAGEQLDGLTETRDAQERLEDAQRHVGTFVAVYRRYVTARITESASAASQAAAVAEKAEKDARDKRAEHLELAEQYEIQNGTVTTLEEDVESLDATISGIKESKSYQDIRDLDERERRVLALAGTADIALANARAARQRETECVAAADIRAREIVDAAENTGRAFVEVRQVLHQAGVTATMPDTVNVQRTAQAPASVQVRRDRTGDRTQVDMPVPATVVVSPTDLTETIAQLGRVGGAAEQRARHAGTRLAEAVRLDGEHQKVESAEGRAAEAEARAIEAAEVMQAALDERDDAARALARAWRSWIASDVSVALLPDVDWTATPVAPLLADVEALVGDIGNSDSLAQLDNTANVAALPVQEWHADALAELLAEDRADEAKRGQLLAEQGTLLAEHDPEPERPTWLTSRPDSAAQFWRTVDFAAHIDAEQRAGIEAALLAAGLLTASVTHGGLTAEDGQVLLAASGPAAARPLSEVLVVDSASPVPAEHVTTVLQRISMGDRAHPTWIDVDGCWANGPLHGRHVGTTARHIGAEARAAARAERLAEIATALAELEQESDARATKRASMQALRTRLSSHLGTSPRSQSLATARSLAAREAERARRAEAEQHMLERVAGELRHAWTAAVSDHRDKCAVFSLPFTADDLDSTERSCDAAVLSTKAAETGLRTVETALGQHSRELATLASVSSGRASAEAEAEKHWRAWHDETTELEAIRESIGAAAEQTKKQLRETEARLLNTKADLRNARTAAEATGQRVSASQVESRQLNKEADDRRGELEAAAQHLTAQLALPGVAAAAVGELTVEMAYRQATPAEVEAMARAVRSKLDRRAAVDQNALMRAQQTLEREVSGTIDVHSEIENGIWLVELADASGHRPLMAAAAELDRRCEEGAAALSERERRVFTDFVLGGVAEELRRRLDQAEALIKAMNASLASIRTSHGIGVKLRWDLLAEDDRRIGRVRDLVRQADEVRPAQDTLELTELLKSMVNDEFAQDRSAGYAAHLTSALDYRAWHQVQVIITGPAPGQERRISRRAKLSQGETRFVSYVTLFAAVDAYLSGLPDTTTALRLILLDDAFAKVDDRTIGELMGLLVRLDLDFAMTGHALWGCYPQVPALDCYEVRRREGTPAITTHVHWDGHNRHLRAAR
jgi:uncharacterized protein (TIGR02680 family)